MQPTILVLDNYDSFTYNLVHLVEKITDEKIDVFRNDAIDIDKVGIYDKIILSPGPGVPSEARIMISLIKKYAATKSILGVCLGHQAIAEAFGAKLINLDTVYHGIAMPVNIIMPGARLWQGIDHPFEAGRYHSWIVSDIDFPNELEITAVDNNGYIMALRHKQFDVQGIQFHPESVLTPCGEKILRNWLK